MCHGDPRQRTPVSSLSHMGRFAPSILVVGWGPSGKEGMAVVGAPTLVLGGTARCSLNRLQVLGSNPRDQPSLALPLYVQEKTCPDKGILKPGEGNALG